MALTMTPIHFYTASTTALLHKIVFKNLVDGNYNISAYMTNWNGTPNLAPTATINFNVASSTYDDGSADIIPVDLPDDIADEIASGSEMFDLSECENISPLNFYDSIVCGFKKFAIWALYPSQTSLNKLNTSYTDIKASFPFNAFFDLTDTVHDAISTTTTSMSGTFDIPFITATGTFYMIPVLSSSTMPSAIGSTNATLIRNSITWVFWALAGFLIFITFKKI
jgi:hypothetical protein